MAKLEDGIIRFLLPTKSQFLSSFFISFLVCEKHLVLCYSIKIKAKNLQSELPKY
jgi:hypothetical protein